MALVYSGRPNPSWSLDEARATEIGRALAAMPPAPESPGLATGLGYAGVRLETVDSQGRPEEWLFAGGRARNGRQWFIDEGRAVERALLRTGAELHGDPILAKLI